MAESISKISTERNLLFLYNILINGQINTQNVAGLAEKDLLHIANILISIKISIHNFTGPAERNLLHLLRFVYCLGYRVKIAGQGIL